LTLLACSGAMDAPVGGPPGTSQLQNSEGVLGSQSDVQNMDNACLTSYNLKFQGDGTGDSTMWYILQADQKNFPTPGIVVKESKGPNVTDDICEDCEGRTVRLIDFGDPKFKPLQEKSEFGTFMIGIWRQQIKPEVLAQARYQDFTVSAVGDVSFKGMPIEPYHLYLFLLSNKPINQVTEPTAFASKEEFFAMTACSNHPEDHPFVHLRAFQARFNEPTVLHLPPGGPVQIDPDSIKNGGETTKPGTNLLIDQNVSPVFQKMKEDDQ